jgi:hypothetical protein
MAAGGAALSVVAFLFLPYVDFIMRLTAPQVIRFEASGNPAWNLVWLTPLATAAIGLVALTQLGFHGRRPSSRLGGFAFVRGLATLVVGVYVLNVGVLMTRDDLGDPGWSVTDHLGTGFWFGVFGVLLAHIGATVEIRNLRRWKRQYGQWWG